MRSQFIEQVQLLMEIQQIKQAEQVFGKSNYTWLCTRKVTMVWMSTGDECRMRQTLHEVTADQQVQTMKKLLIWLDANPHADVLEIPQITLILLNNAITNNMIAEANFSRMASFRNSLKRLTMGMNKISPIQPTSHNGKSRRSVTFNDVPVIYRIFK